MADNTARAIRRGVGRFPKTLQIFLFSREFFLFVFRAPSRPHVVLRVSFPSHLCGQWAPPPSVLLPHKFVVNNGPEALRDIVRDN